MAPLLRPALVLFALFSALTGLVYPLLVTGIAQTVFPYQAHGSLVSRAGQPVGSELIGQSFAEPGYFWSRPSATTPMQNNGQSSGASNLGPTNPLLEEAVRGRIEHVREGAPAGQAPVPIDLVTASASGLDPDISPAAARYQIERVARTRTLPAEQLEALIQSQVEEPQWGIFGQPRVNVLRLNLALDALAVKR